MGELISGWVGASTGAVDTPVDAIGSSGFGSAVCPSQPVLGFGGSVGVASAIRLSGVPFAIIATSSLPTRDDTVIEAVSWGTGVSL
jgi:hypothetical protein